MEYRVIKSFTDLQDGGYPYHEGDIFPREGLTVSEERIEKLATSNNKQRTPLIVLVISSAEETGKPADSAEETSVKAEAEKPVKKPRKRKKTEE